MRRDRERDWTWEGERKRKAKWEKGDWGESGRGERRERRKLQRRKGSCREVHLGLFLLKLLLRLLTQHLIGSSDLHLHLPALPGGSLFGEAASEALILDTRGLTVASSVLPFLFPLNFQRWDFFFTFSLI